MIISTPHPSPRPLGPGTPSGRADAAATPFAAPADAPDETAPDPAEPGSVTGSAPPAEPTGSGLAGAVGVSHRSDVAALRQWINHPELRNDLPLPDLTVDHHGTGFQKAVAAYQAATATVDPAPVTAPVTDPAPIASTPVVDPDPTTDQAPTTDATAGTDPVLTGPIADPPASDPAVLGNPVPTAEQPTVVTDPAPAAVDTRTVFDAPPVVQADPLLDPALLPDTGSTTAI